MTSRQISETLLQIKSLSVPSKVGEHSFKSAQDLSTLIESLKGTPVESVPLLVEAISNRALPLEFRLNLAQALSEMRPRFSSAHVSQLADIARSQGEPPLIRIYAGHLLLLNPEIGSSKMKAEIASISVNFARTGIEPGFVRMLLLPRLRGSKEVESLILDELRHSSDLNSTLHIAGKLKIKRAIPRISELLASAEAGKSFYKTRAYLALGEIGGEEAYKRLTAYLESEPIPLERDMILLAIGCSRASQAKDFLIARLFNGPNIHYPTTLEALRLLGDKTIIPTLESELKRPLSEYRKGRVRRTIAALEKGDTEPAF